MKSRFNKFRKNKISRNVSLFIHNIIKFFKTYLNLILKNIEEKMSQSKKQEESGNDEEEQKDLRKAKGPSNAQKKARQFDFSAMFEQTVEAARLSHSERNQSDKDDEHIPFSITKATTIQERSNADAGGEPQRKDIRSTDGRHHNVVLIQ